MLGDGGTGYDGSRLCVECWSMEEENIMEVGDRVLENGANGYDGEQVVW